MQDVNYILMRKENLLFGHFFLIVAITKILHGNYAVLFYLFLSIFFYGCYFNDNDVD